MMPWAVVLGGQSRERNASGDVGHPAPPDPASGSESGADLADRAVFLISSYALPKVKAKRAAPGTVFLCYVVLYSLARFVIEFYRGDDPGRLLVDFIRLPMDRRGSLSRPPRL